MAEVTFTVDGKQLTAPKGTLLIDACRRAGIEIPAFCYYPGLSLQAACRMCLVRQEKVGKLQTACTTQVAEGQIFFTDTPEIHQARKGMLELLLGNHPLDCPVCDAGGECELQDMTFKYGAGESLYSEAKNHREEQQWSPAVFYDRPRCILCYRCIRVCGEGMDEWALGIQNRGSRAVIAPNGGDHLDCSQCGMCIDICPVGALTSGAYRYKTRPWEMNHVATVCTHCADGCTVTLGVRQTAEGAEIVRADNRSKSGMNNDFLCAKGRFGFDFVGSEERLTQPLVRNAAGKLEPATWEHALRTAAAKLKEIRDAKGGETIGVVAGNHLTNEEFFLLQKIAHTVLGTVNLDHERTADYATFVRALAGQVGKAASLRDTLSAPAVLVVGGNATEEHPLVAWNLRTNVRLNRGHLYVATEQPVPLDHMATASLRLPANATTMFTHYLNGNDTAIDNAEFRQKLLAEESLMIVIATELTGKPLANLIAWGLERGNVRFALLGAYANSRGAADMGLDPALGPGYVDAAKCGNGMDKMIAADSGLEALLIAGANPAAHPGFSPVVFKNTFVIVQDIFLTETAALADVVLPTTSLYEKTGTVTNAFGDVQMLNKAADNSLLKSDFEILARLAAAMGADVRTLVPLSKTGATADLGQSRGAESGEADRHDVYLKANQLEPRLSLFNPRALLDEIARTVPGYAIDRLQLFMGNAVPTEPGLTPAAPFTPRPGIEPARDTLFTSGTLGRYSKALDEIARHQTREKAKADAD